MKRDPEWSAEVRTLLNPTTCELCERELPAPTSKRGRPRTRHDHCRQIEARLVQMDKAIDELNREGITDNAKLQLRGRFFSMANRMQRAKAKH